MTLKYFGQNVNAYYKKHPTQQAAAGERVEDRTNKIQRACDSIIYGRVPSMQWLGCHSIKIMRFTLLTWMNQVLMMTREDWKRIFLLYLAVCS